MNKATILKKQETVSTIASQIKEAKSLVVVEYRGVSVSALEALRKELRKEGAFIKVYKNTLVERATHELDLNLDQELVGPNAFVFSNEDAVSAPKIIAKAAKTNKNLVVKGGVVEGRVCDSKQMNEVAKLPSREGLYAMILSCITSPIRGVACAIKAVADAKEENA